MIKVIKVLKVKQTNYKKVLNLSPQRLKRKRISYYKPKTNALTSIFNAVILLNPIIPVSILYNESGYLFWRNSNDCH